MATVRPTDAVTAVARDGDLGGNAASLKATVDALARAGSAVAAVLVEGISDQIALETAATRRGRDLAAERVVIVPIGGAHAIGNVLTGLRPRGTGLRVAGLCDRREEEIFRRALDVLHAGAVRTRADMEQLGFHVCVDDLEQELIRALGAAQVEALFESHGDLRAFHAFQSQPAWRGREPEAQMWRFLRSSSRRNLRYARLLAEAAVDRNALPRPLDALLPAV
ncbi:TOPRIM nucleotidyl transferase/hydrolase domain-containing protein [Melissospora conviva]|uniref:TOPRIM nucleotidyl transferase/hydrolase domain-containing protein n=1 Tax=Melissospora conviva TaxID=3388432 RepID=UPI003C1F7A60